MTKKSQARLLRDQNASDLKKTSCWADLNVVKEQCNNLLRAHLPLAELIMMPQVYTNVPDVSTFAKTVRIFSADLATLHTELGAIGALHEGKEGTAATVDELMHSIQISESYALWMERHGALIEPAVTFLSEQADLAVAKVKAQQASGLTPEQDPNVVTDVTVH